MNSAQGSLTLLNAHTGAPQVFWDGVRVEHVKRIYVHSDEDESRVKIVVTEDSPLVASMVASGINVKVQP